MMIYSVWICMYLLVGICSLKDDEYNIDGIIADGWQFIHQLFKENFVEKRDFGASIAVYYDDELVVDLWGGSFDRSSSKPYDNNTLQLVFSTSKGVVAIAVALCVERGLLDYSELVTKYWPEYGQNGKENTTVGDILSHRAGLAYDYWTMEQIVNWTEMIHLLEEEKPLWLPGTAHSYHALTYGWLAGELIRRVDPKNRTLGQFIQDEIANEIDIQFYIGLPIEEEYRVSPLTLSLETLQQLNDTMKALYNLYNDPRVHRAEIPAANGITNARSLAKLYASLIMDLDQGKQKRLLNETILKQAIKSNTPEYELDLLTNTSLPFSMGFAILDQIFPFFKSQIFGHPGAGGSIAFAIPSKKLSFAYVMNQLDIETTNVIYPRFKNILEEIAKYIDDN